MKIIKQFISFLFDFRRKFILKEKIRRIYSGLKEKETISKEIIKQHEHLWTRLGSRPDLRWIRSFISLNKIHKPEYITEIDYYNEVEPKLNNRTFSEAYCDKNFYHNYLDKNLLPAVYIRNIEHGYYDESYKDFDFSGDLNDHLPVEVEAVVVKKAVDSGGGRGVELFTREDRVWKNSVGDPLSKSYLVEVFKKNFIIQELIHQHDYFQRFNPSSVNTVRILTYRSVESNEIFPLQAVLRIGRKGAFVDNQASGGIVCGIDTNGKLNSFAVNKGGDRLNSYNGVVFSEVNSVYLFSKIVQEALILAKKFYYHRLLGFDFAVDIHNQIRLIEINNRNNEINFYQMTNGPLFREFTEEVIEFCLKSRKTLSFDFEV